MGDYGSPVWIDEDDESWNYVILPPKPPLITNTDSSLAHFMFKISAAYIYLEKIPRTFN